MTSPTRINLIGGLLDLPLVDKNGAYCGVVDDIELSDEVDQPPTVRHLLVGPGAYRGRLPAWIMPLVWGVAGTRVTRVPWEAIDRVDSCVTLTDTADALGLHLSENRVRAVIPRRGAW